MHAAARHWHFAKMCNSLFPRALATLISGLLLLTPAFANTALLRLQDAASAASFEISAAEIVANAKKSELVTKYIQALSELEKTLSGKGGLDSIIHLREEKESVSKTGSPTKHKDAPIVKLRERYLTGVTGIDKEVKAVRVKASAAFQKFVQEQEKSLTKAGNIEEALEFRKQATQLAGEMSGGSKGGLDNTQQWLDPDAGGATLDPLKNLEARLVGTSWTFEEKKRWVRFEKEGKLFVAWANSSFGKWKVVDELTVEFSPWTDGRKEVLKLNASLRSGTITNLAGETTKTEQIKR